MFVGLDVHKRETQVAVFGEGKKPLREARVKTSPSSLKRVLKDVEGPVALEAVGFYRPIARWLMAEGHEVRLANPRLIPKPKVKTDKKDAKHLAKLLKADLLPEAWIPSEEIQRLRDLVRHRRFLAEEVGRLKAKVKHDLYKHGHFVEKNPADTQKGRTQARKLLIPEVHSTLRILQTFEEEIKAYDRTIREEAAKRSDVQLLTTIPGVGDQTALGIYAEVGDFSRFDHPEKLASYAGMSILEEQSGDRDRKGRITKEGNTLLLTLLVEAAHNHILHCHESQITAKYRRKQERSGTKRAQIAAARSLLHAMHAMLRTQQPFTVNPRSPDKGPAA